MIFFNLSIYLSHEAKAPFDSRNCVWRDTKCRWNLIREYKKITWKGGGRQFQLLLSDRPRKGGANQIAELVDVASSSAALRIPKPLVQHILEIVRRGRLIVDDETVFEDFQIVLRRFQKLLHGSFHARLLPREQIKRAIIAVRSNVFPPQLKNCFVLVHDL